MLTNSPKDVLHGFFDALLSGDPDACLDLMADDIVWTIAGTTVLAGVYRGKQEVVQMLCGGMAARLKAGPPRYAVHRVISEGEIAVLQARGEARSVSGLPCNQEYCIVARVVDGRLLEGGDYLVVQEAHKRAVDPGVRLPVSV